MKYVFFIMECYPLPLAKHLLDEGNEVFVGVFGSFDQLKVPEIEDDDTPNERRQRMSLYDGMLRKVPVETLFSFLKKIPETERSEYFVFFDSSDLYNISERVMRMGFKNGLLPTKFYYEMEHDREKAKVFVRRHYDEIKLAEWICFDKVNEAVQFMEEAEKVYVLKSNGKGETVVPKGSDVDLAKTKIIEALKKGKKDYESSGFLLEEKITDCIEVTPVMVFYNGSPVYSIVEFESKSFGAGDIGAQKGGSLCLSVKTELDCKINKMAFPKIIYQLAKKQTGLSIFDIGLLYDGEDFYFTEFCGMRYGWDGIFSEMVMRDDGEPFVGNYFQDIVNGENPIKRKYGASVRLFNLNGKAVQTKESECDVDVNFEEELNNNLFFYSVKKSGKKTVSVGGLDLLAVATGSSDVLETAVNKAYEVVEGINCSKIFYRPKFDFLSMEYKSSILNRLSAIKSFI